MIQIFHNSRCSKSRQCLSLIENSGKKFEVIKYLENPPTITQLTEIISKLGIEPIDLVRKKEKLWIENYKKKFFLQMNLLKLCLKILY
jgi:arsenate reductase